MPHEMEENGAEVSDPMSENEDETETFKNEKMADQSATENTTEVKKKYDPKDPMRPRRKKARRACYACQRAHLTCGRCCLILSLSLPILRVSWIWLAGSRAARLGGAALRWLGSSSFLVLAFLMP